MTIQTLVSTMHQTDYSLLDKMNIQTDAVVVNQCDRNEITEFDYKGHKVLWLSLKERGVGLSRNTALMRSDADIALFADDDVVYEDGYADEVLKAFEENPKADLMTFNFVSLNEERPEALDKKFHRLRWYNCLKYGAFRIAVRRQSALKKNLYFSLLFGGGAPHQAGEDNLFVVEALKYGLKLFASEKTLGTVKQENSTWFAGYDEKYYEDRGFLFANMFGKKAGMILLLFELKDRKRRTDLSLKQRLKTERKGISFFFKNNVAEDRVGIVN